MSERSYVFSRNASASVRLYFQHWMWRYQLGYLLHPTIPTDKEGLQIADVACGTGIWLVELARILPASTKLDGYDISSEQYPAKEWLPKNVTLGTLNALDTVPDALRGKYDIVHISLFVMLVRNEDPGPILNNLMLMLKPGGYLQWDESDPASLHPEPTDPAIAHPYYDELHGLMAPWLTARGFTYKWVSEMDKHFRAHGLDVLTYFRVPICNDLAKPWTDNQLMGTRDIIEHFVIPSLAKSGQDADPMTADRLRELFDKYAVECQQGLSVKMDMLVAVGKKLP